MSWILTILARAWPLLLGLCLVVGLLIAGIGWRDHQSAVAAARTQAAIVVAGAREASADAATGAVADLGDRDTIRNRTTEENRNAILGQSDAEMDAGDAGRAGLVGLCRRAAYRNDPRCLELRGADSAPATR
jgi:hypothetical protein